MKIGRDTIWSASVILAAAVFAWLCTIPSAIALINWDNAAYIADIASGGYDWSHMPWSSHLGIGHAYKLGVWLAQALGGTVIDGFRIVNARGGVSIKIADGDTLAGHRVESVEGFINWLKHVASVLSP